ncbi:hypothetical protein GUJ93_ZPchr0008g12313 [Zizania palustris]|uniref:Uncharacterized protein n=1 Tax=Zizania palustris TaxID=103762 RepID=A0A8J5RAS8_ZIZPA|nr:hypothetical protein GUJ93_ZPchr0008g12313 [Zizania palustris]
MATTTSRHWRQTPAQATTSRRDSHLSELDSTRRRIFARRSGTNADHLSSPASSPANGDRSAEASGETFVVLSAEGRTDPLDEVRRRRHGTIANHRKKEDTRELSSALYAISSDRFEDPYCQTLSVIMLM